jgi:hypothetical protein
LRIHTAVTGLNGVQKEAIRDKRRRDGAARGGSRRGSGRLKGARGLL